MFSFYRRCYWSFITPIIDIVSGSTFRFFAFLAFGTDSEWTRENEHPAYRTPTLYQSMLLDDYEGDLAGGFPREDEGRPFWWYNGIMDYVEYF
jgi:hypothetical protein